MLSIFTLAATATTATVPVSSGSSDLTRVLLQFLAIIVIFYLFFVRPQQKKANEQMKMLKSLKVGDEVLINGIIGKISKLINEAEVLVEVSKGVEIKVLRSFISNVLIENEDVKPENKK